MKISILTPTYNRANLLDKLYTSLLINHNTCNCDIEWLIMDDGSEDNTRQVIESYMKERIINVQYFCQQNSGKMAALNELVKKASGDIIIECDSDDFFAINAFSIIEESIKQCEDWDNTYAMLFLKYDQHGQNMGNDFPEDNYVSTMFNLYFKEGITGEKVLVFNSTLRKQFNYELENGEKFITESRMYHKMDLQYNVRCFNKKLMICEYKPDGYSKNINILFRENPNGYFQYFKEIFDQNMHGVKLKKRLYIYKHYILFATLSGKEDAISQVKGLSNKIMMALLYWPGVWKTKRKFRKE